MSADARPPLPPFTDETAARKVRLAEDAWNCRDPHRVALAYTLDSQWRNRSRFLQGRDQIIAFLTEEWAAERQYRLIKEKRVHQEPHIAVRFAHEYHDASGQWFRAYGNENWEFEGNGLMRRRIASINDLAIDEHDRKLTFEQGWRPVDFPGLSALGLLVRRDQ